MPLSLLEPDAIDRLLVWDLHGMIALHFGIEEFDFVFLDSVFQP